MTKKCLKPIWKGLAMLFLACLSINAIAQDVNVHGTVVDAKDQPIVGAKVILKTNHKKGAITNFDGKFIIKNIPQNATLIASYVGMKSQEIEIKGKTSITIKLVDDTSQLDELIVVGYGTQKKVNVTGSVSTVDAKQLASRPVRNVAQALQGTVPGLNMSIGNGGGALNSNMGLNIRGGGTIGAGSNGNPLVLIDGIEGDINSINPNDIENISVLKDAASSSIYGARGAFGVILITTKNGRKGETHVSYIGNVRYNSATQIPDMVNSLEFANYFNDAQQNQNGQIIFHEEQLTKIKNFLDGKYTDPKTPEYYGTEPNLANGMWKAYGAAFANTNWFDEFYKKNVPSYEHNLSVSGGNEKVTYRISAGMLDQNGLLRHGKDELKHYTMNAKVSAKMYNWLTINYMSKWSNIDYSRPQYIDAGGLFYHNIARRWPTNPTHVFNHPMPSMEINELEQGGVTNTNTNSYTNQMQLIFEPFKDWHITVDGSARSLAKKEHMEILKMYDYNAEGEPKLGKVGYNSPGFTSVEQKRWMNDYYQFNITTDYSKEFGKHYFKLLGGFNSEFFHDDYLQGSATDLITDGTPYLNAAQDNFKGDDEITELAIAGFFGRINYSFNEKYLLEANIRYDGSSRFIGDKRWGLFPSFSLGWNIAREGFFESLQHQISTLKLRASWGQLGNNETKSRYPFFLTMKTGNADSKWLVNNKQLNTAKMPGIVSSNLTWETVESWNIGFDIAALNNRLTGTFDYYNRYTYNMVGPAPTLPEILGTNPPQINNADLLSYGWELQLHWRDQIKEFNYGIGFNVSDGLRKILRYQNETGSLGSYDKNKPGDFYKDKLLGDIWGYTTVGIAQSQEEMDKHLENNKPNWGSKWAAGDVMYKDLNGDHKVSAGSNTLNDHGDLSVIGNSTPRYNFGINLDASYKGFDFALFLQGVGKRQVWLDGTYFWGASGSMWQSAVFSEHLNYWTKNRKDAYYPRPIFGEEKNHQIQTKYLQDASYVRIKNIQFGYTLPKALSRRLLVSKLRMYVSVDNLATFTKLNKVFDPEAIGGKWGTGKLYPLQKTLSFGVNINL